MIPGYRFEPTDSSVVVTAIHAGHTLRSSLCSRSAVPEARRWREEDPHTDELIPSGCGRVAADVSRFEVDLNRPRESAVYRDPDDAWGLELWNEPLPASEIEDSLRRYDAFYGTLPDLLDPVAERGPFLVLDLHSYNHRRRGPLEAPDDPTDNPEVNIGTRWLDRDRWGPLADEVIDSFRRSQVADHALDVRENVRFKGGQLTRWVNSRYEGRGCALAIEFKKVFMDEWTGSVDRCHLRQLAAAVHQAADDAARFLGSAP